MKARQTTKNLIKAKQKKREMPKKCPACKSVRLELLSVKEYDPIKKCIIYKEGFYCMKCGYRHARRYK